MTPNKQNYSNCPKTSIAMSITLQKLQNVILQGGRHDTEKRSLDRQLLTQKQKTQSPPYYYGLIV